MIPKPLNEIQWGDIEALQVSGREEDDAIEYKGSFTGGSDYLSFGDAEQKRAVAGIAKEAIAFLNARGGDIIIGASEAKNDHPRIEQLVPLLNVDATVDRLSQSLAALIEPMQSVLQLRAIKQSQDKNEGIIVVRAPSSLRAPHRFTVDKECYIRRGRSSVKMPMDEVQDLTLNRASRRSEVLNLLDRQFLHFNEERSGHYNLEGNYIHLASVFVPYVYGQDDLNSNVLRLMMGADPQCPRGEKLFHNDVAFRNVSYSWKPMLHGKRIDGFHNNNNDTFRFCMKSIKRNLVMATEYADTGHVFDNGAAAVHWEWIVGYLANSLFSIRSVLRELPEFQNGVLRVRMRVSGNMPLRIGDHWSSDHPFEPGCFDVLEVDIRDCKELDGIFQQLQVDVAAIAGLEEKSPCSLPTMQ